MPLKNRVFPVSAEEQSPSTIEQNPFRLPFPAYRNAFRLTRKMVGTLMVPCRFNNGISVQAIYTLICAVSTACATRSIVASSKCLPITCTPIGSPPFVVPHGTDTPQIPARLAATE